MCVSPLKIIHPTKDFKVTDSLTVSVPCGHCYECRRRKQSDIELRIYNELCYNQAHGFKNYFFTLTYNNAEIPTLILPSGNEVNVFDKSHWTTFYDNLQKRFRRKYGIGKKNGLPKMSYIVCCEKGGKYGRPHLHIAMSVPAIVSSEEFHESITDLWRGQEIILSNGELATDEDGNSLYDGNGFVFPRHFYSTMVNGKKLNGIEIIGNPAQVSRYVSKYVTKDLSFFEDNDELNEYIQYYKNELNQEDGDPEAEDILNDLKQYLPFTCHSQNYGIHLLDDIKTDDVITTVENIKKGVLTSRFDKKKGTYVDTYRPLPTYILRKILFDVSYIREEDKYLVRHDLNKYGIYYKQTLYKDIVKAESAKLQNMYVKYRLNGRDYRELNVFSEKIALPNIKYTSSDWEKIAIYKLTFRDKVVPYLYGTYTDVLPKEFDYNDIQQYKEFANQYSVLYPIRRDGIKMTQKRKEELTKKTFNTLPIFAGLDALLDVLDTFNNVERLENSQVRTKKDSINQQLRHLYNV